MGITSTFQLSGRALRLLLLFTAGNAFLLFGYDQGVCGGITTLPAFLNNFNHPNATMLGFMVSAYNVSGAVRGYADMEIGCFTGAGFAFALGDKLGRKKAVLAGCLTLCVGASLQASAFTQAQWIVGRIIAGMGTGSISSTVPVWISECSKAHRRGPLVVVEVSMVIVGIVLAAWSNYGLLFHAPWLDGTQAQWQIPVALQMMFPVLVFTTLWLCPESPRWLAQVGRYDEVAPVLARLEGKAVSVQDPAVQQLAREIITTAHHEADLETSWKECFEMGELQNFRRLVICGLAGFLQQATGINVVIYYAPTVFASVGMDAETSTIMGAGASCAFLLGSVLPLTYIERFGRRNTMIMGSATNGACMLAVAICVALSDKYPGMHQSTGYAACAFIFLYEFTFGIGWNSMCWLYGSEIASLRLRNKGSSVQNILNWMTCFLTVMTTPVGLQNIGWRLYLVWAVITFAGIPIVYCFFPETTGRSLEQMDAFFAKYQRWYIADVAYERVDFLPSQDEDDISTTTPDGKGISAHMEMEMQEAKE